MIKNILCIINHLFSKDVQTIINQKAFPPKIHLFLVYLGKEFKVF